MRPSSGSCFHTTVAGISLVAQAADVDLADQSVVWVREGDEAFILCACNMQVLAKGRGVFIAAPDAYLFAVEVGVVSPCSA
jgi:hypothetical protein